MNNFFIKYKIPILSFIFIAGFLLRINNYLVWPRLGATFDEYAWSWLGINLIQKGTPISWSPHPQYKDRTHLIYQGAAFWIVKPYLEHPPVFGLVAGGFSLLAGAKDMYHLSLSHIRPLAIILGMVSLVMVFIFASQLYGLGIGIIATLLYATIPTVVIGSRIVQNENFLIPLWLFCLFLLHKYLKSGKKKFRNLAAIFSGVLSLAKAPWLVVGFSLVLILLHKQKFKDAIFVGSTVFFIFTLFILYGVYFDRELFFSLWQLQLARYDISFGGFYSLLTKPLLVDRYYLDGWIYFGYASILLLAQNFKKHLFILFPFLAYLLIFVFAIPDEPGHGWYRYPFYSFLTISIALFLRDYFVKNQLLTFFFLIFVGLSLFQLTWQVVFGFSLVVYRLSLVLFSLSLFSVFFPTKKFRKISEMFGYGWFLVFIILNVWSVLIYNEQ